MPRCSPALLLVSLIAACGTDTEATEGSTTDPTSEAPTDEADEELVRKVDPERLRTMVHHATGNHRVVNFWATWCGPCVEELPELEAFGKAHPEVEVLLVNLDYPTLTRSHVEPFVKRHDLVDMRVVQLDDADPARAMGDVVDGWPYAIPFTMVVDPEGRVGTRWDGGITREDLEGAMASW